MRDIEQKVVDTIRMLSIDMVEKANSGHPGMPMGSAPMAYTLFSKVMNVNPKNPNWFNRDRFVLSAGHGSALLYSMLHLYGYDVSMDDLKAFRQLDSKTPGHPEHGHTPGVDATSGPLGQGIAMAVGMALAENHLSAKYNKPEYDVVSHYTYAICGDGDLMEGVASEAASLAGHLALGKLIILYDSNDISLDGELNQSFSESVAKRFDAYKWQVLRVEDGNDADEILAAVETAKKDNRPTLIEVKTVIGYGSPNKGGTSASHGAPLGKDEVALVRENYGWNYDPFTVPEDVKQELGSYVDDSTKKEETWNTMMEAYGRVYPELKEELERTLRNELPEDYDKDFPVYAPDQGLLATRSASGQLINALAARVPELFGGSADLGGSNNTFIKSEGAYSPATPANRNIWYGVREFAEGAIMNGLMLHGGVKTFGSTFFVFSDYMRPAIRMASLMKLPVTYVFTHDSIAVGEDGPTHEPIEQLASLRAMPNLHVIRPADAKETLAAWKEAIASTDRPTALILSRQVLPILENDQKDVTSGVAKGAYVVSPAAKAAKVILVATGSEVSLALETQKLLHENNVDSSVVSMPSWHNFKALSCEERTAILPKDVVKVSIEAGTTFGWGDIVGDNGLSIGIDHFGASAPASDIFASFGLTAKDVCAKVLKHLNK
ncbi:transketolase [Breznakia pachnodae]|uniref:Transketolase n=1 Tax=Breznakia pachnodae TaxID=265178 RepID=A0ABU0DYG8_9FIRM|nr:transketolase [Breznakia pachnodae]MDQ0359677.1 transketolase [Breznakia pachnodae]